MKSKTRWVLIIASAVLVLVIAIGGLLSQSEEREGIYKRLDIFVEVMRHIRSDYVENVETTSIFDGALKGMLRTLDVESSYLTVEEYKAYIDELPRRKASTGIEVVKDPVNGYARVVHIRSGSPADSSGVEEGDFIRAIDGRSTRDVPIMMIQLMMAGQPDSTATFSILRSGLSRFLEFEVARAELPKLEATWKVTDGIGHIVVPTFELGILEQVQKACEEFDNAGVNSLIIDVRGNLEGNLDEAVHVADLFVSSGKLLSVKSKSSSTDYEADEQAWDFELLVLCDETTARAAEAFVVCLSDRDLATIVGRRTVGIGTLQKKIEMEDGALLNISFARVIGPEGSEVQESGITPDEEVPQNDEDDHNDNILIRAIQLVKEKQGQSGEAAA